MRLRASGVVTDSGEISSAALTDASATTRVILHGGIVDDAMASLA